MANKASTKSKSKSSGSKSSGSKSTASRGRSAASRPKSAPQPPRRVRTEEELARDKDIAGIVICAVAVIMLISFLMAPQPDRADVGALGLVSLFIVRVLRMIGGGVAVALPIGLLIYGIATVADKNSYGRSRLIGLILLILALFGLCHLSVELTPFKEYMQTAVGGAGGGAIGALLDFALCKTIGRVGAIVVFVAMLLIGLLLALQTTTREVAALMGRGAGSLHNVVRHSHRGEITLEPGPAVAGAGSSTGAALPAETASGKGKQGRRGKGMDLVAPTITDSREPGSRPAPPGTAFSDNYLPHVTDARPEGESTLVPGLTEHPPVKIKTYGDDDGKAAEERPRKQKEPRQPKGPKQPAQQEPAPEPEPPQVPAEEPAEEIAAAPSKANTEGYRLPTPELIEAGLCLRNPRMNAELTENIAKLENTLASFGVRATVTQVVAGPAVIRYELQPAAGVKVSRITALADDIALALAAAGVRIEAPIPGKSAIGIEVARKETETVFFREMIDSEEFQKSKAKLSFALGKNIGGEYIVGNLVKMPHLLIAGATGSGKSICINTIICSILFKATPDEVKLMLIDSKKVEMTQYARLPHLIAPVVNDSRKASNALKWVVNEMENRYSLFAGSSSTGSPCRDFDSYNQQHPDTPLHHIVVIIDELADLMMVAKRDVEDSICRLAQMARAAGIHLVVATQRPSVDVITGLIKANIPSRIAFAVSSYTDSRTILDMGGAEKLLGKGDMLYAPIGMNKPMRVQGTFISEQDVARLVEYCCEQAAPKYSEAAVDAAVNGKDVGDSSGGAMDEDRDELLYDAAMLIVDSGQASVSFLQRRLAIGNPRAARIMDQLERLGVVGPSKGAKPRDILMSPDEIEALLG